MRIILLIIRKEFIQIFRNKAILPMIFVTPIIQLLIMPLAANFETKNILLAVVDHDRTDYSERLTEKIRSSGYFSLQYYGNSYKQAMDLIESDKADLILEIPPNFKQGFGRNETQNLFVAVNAINGVKALLGGAYIQNIIADFNQKIRMDWTGMPQPSIPNQPQFTIASSNWFNPYQNYKWYTVPGILGMLVTMSGAYMCAINIVKEREFGTIEQINVSPIKKHQFILGKLIPFWLMGIFTFSLGFWGVSRFVYDIIPQGSIMLIYFFLLVYLSAIMGFGLLVSTYSDTQQQAMSVAFLFLILFTLMSGLFTSVASMPEWAIVMTRFNPLYYIVEVMRVIILKGSTLYDIKKEILTVGAFSTVLNTWAVLHYSKRN